jgi:hypothetical protein
MTQHTTAAKRLVIPAFIGLALMLAGGAVLYATHGYVEGLQAERQQTLRQSTEAESRLRRLRNESQEITQRVATYEQLVRRGIVGAERRLEWVEALERLRARDGSRTFRYTIEPQKTMDAPQSAAGISARASQVKLSASVPHEAHAFELLSELQASVPAHVLLRSCILDSPLASAAASANLNLQCSIEFVTIEVPQ